MPQDPKPLFGPEDVVFTYTDEQAVDDGVLVPVSAKDRVTRNCFDFLTKTTPMDSKPPDSWPVDLMGWMRAGVMKPEDALRMIAKYGKDSAQTEFEQLIRDTKAVALARGLIGTYRERATRTWNENLDGGVFKLYAILDGMAFDIGGVGQTLASLSEKLPPEPKADRSGTYSTLWLIPNEQGGVTLMFPEDY